MKPSHHNWINGTPAHLYNDVLFGAIKLSGSPWLSLIQSFLLLPCNIKHVTVNLTGKVYAASNLRAYIHFAFYIGARWMRYISRLWKYKMALCSLISRFLYVQTNNVTKSSSRGKGYYTVLDHLIEHSPQHLRQYRTKQAYFFNVTEDFTHLSNSWPVSIYSGLIIVLPSWIHIAQ